MAIPDFQSCMRPLLHSVSDGEIHTFNNAFERVCQFFKLSDAELQERLPSGKQTVIRNRVAWSRTYMGKGGLLTAPGRSQLQITERGKQALVDEPDRVSVKYLKKYPEPLEFHTANPKSIISSDDSGNLGSIDSFLKTQIEQRLESVSLQEIRVSLVAKLLFRQLGVLA